MVDIVDGLADCLETLRSGGDLAVCLERYPQHRTQLEALLRVAALIRPLPADVIPSYVFRQTTRSRILEPDIARDWYSPGEEPSETY